MGSFSAHAYKSCDTGVCPDVSHLVEQQVEEVMFSCSACDFRKQYMAFC